MAITVQRVHALWWVGGQTYPHREVIKAAGGRWSPKQKKWYLTADTLPPEIMQLPGATLLPARGDASAEQPKSASVPKPAKQPKASRAKSAPKDQTLDDEGDDDDALIPPAPPEPRKHTLVLKRPPRRPKSERVYPVAQNFIGEISGAVGVVYCMGAALDPDNKRPVYVSMVGSSSSVESAWAKLALGMPLRVIGYEGDPVELHPDNQGTLARMQTKLALGLDHLMLVHKTIVEPVYAESSLTYLIFVTPQQAWARLGEHLTNLVKIAVFPEWYKELFQRGIDKALIARCLCYGGIDIYRVRLNLDQWTDIIKHGVSSGALTLPEAV